MDFTALSAHFELIVVLACLVIGYVIKHASFLKMIPNDDIPIILCVFGGILNCVVSGFGIESIVYGCVMGLASTGLHQQFSHWISNSGASTNTPVE